MTTLDTVTVTDRNGQTPSRTAKLVVIGDGMVGVRAIEEIVARAGGERFSITVFGIEAFGTHNRILLSNVLAGADDTAEILLNRLDWYADDVEIPASSSLRPIHAAIGTES